MNENHSFLILMIRSCKALVDNNVFASFYVWGSSDLLVKIP